ncbi:hypothetical protein [Methylobacterium sp. WL18]|uniref:hypothetical protein n=1 Tax=Methylobacterium sp. WL18 TaxID=2603897 RepID=UPI001FEDE2B3|nr:hypothetical protein [Methylobacterium sp. WL18]
MPPEPQAPKSLADPAALAARRALIDAPHIAPIRALADRIAAERGAAVPVPDPLDGGVAARMLLLLETPGPAVLRTGFVTRDRTFRLDGWLCAPLGHPPEERALGCMIDALSLDDPADPDATAAFLAPRPDRGCSVATVADASDPTGSIGHRRARTKK